MWKEIKDQKDIDEVLDNFGYFHDSCLRDIYISTREYIDEKLAMHFDNKLTASLLFQRQFKPNTVIELKFEDIERFNFLPFNETENPVIYDATLMIINGIFYWADFSEWKIGNNDSIWISGKKLFWRQRLELIGNKKRLMDT
jgi:DNA-directed RNA polymerase subunit N (RpoN/RPB10)